ncbi:MAG: pyridoxal 5'-phosphate synthase glutaminase subunit PdxT, partial [Acidimicrobiales bacterium]|nr:pyridoxal 5'-phosphate synthase glutaminase subunit PdxT [Acidimicrobiales bacterium]
GVLALQGAFAAHIAILESLGVDTIEVRSAEQLADVDALILPGGESTTVSMLLERFGLLEQLRSRIHDEQLPVFGTCAGMILLAEEILDGRADQHCLKALPMSARRNGYGRQLASFETDLDIDGLDEPFHGIFIRAPTVERIGAGVEVLAKVDGQPVMCRHEAVTVASFHPELSGDARLHKRWLVDAGLIPA